MTRTGLVVSAACVAVASGVAPQSARAQQQQNAVEAAAPRDRVLPEAREDREERYTGGPVPAGAHLETRVNPYLTATGATVFLLAYVPFAVEGIVSYASPPSNPSSLAFTNVWFAIPIVGPIISGFAYDARQRDQCAMYAAMSTSMNAMTATAQPNPAWCTDLNAGMRNAMGQALTPNWTPNLNSVGGWIFESSLAVLQAAGLATFIWGLFADRVVVYPANAQVTARASGGRRVVRRSPRPAMRFIVSPGAAGADAGLTLSGVYF